MPPRDILIASTIELALIGVGLVLLWRLVLSPRARVARPPAALGAWDISLSSFHSFFWIVICGGLTAQFAALQLFKLFKPSADEKLVWGSAAFELGLLMGIVIFRVTLGHRPPRAAWATAGAVLSGATTFFIALPIVTVLSLGWHYFLERCGLPVEKQDLIRLFTDAQSPLLFIIMAVLATIGAPLAEELIFRATIFRYLRTRIPRWGALVAPACLFAALHTNLASFVPLVALGIIFSLAYERTGRIATSVIAHGLFNLHSIVLIFVAPGVT
ncbi:MAG: CPBP family intramembrane metalloprotease [Opitutus sp.]|nr:CPBP family intramembrane metalloprotease [Opitutus sp.]